MAAPSSTLVVLKAASACLPKRPLTAFHTLKKRSEFKRLTDKGAASFSHHLIVQYLPPEPESDLRIGFTVSRRIGNAVKRNRVKRQLRAMTRELCAEERFTTGSYTLVARNGAYEASYTRLKTDLTYCLKKLKK